MINKIIFRDLRNSGGNAGIASVRFYDEKGEIIESGDAKSASNTSSPISKNSNMIITSDYFKTTTEQTGTTSAGKPIYTTYNWVVDKAFKTSNTISSDNCWISDQVNTSDSLKIEFLIPVYKMSQIRFITSNEGVGGNAPQYKLTQPFYIDIYDEMDNLFQSYEVTPPEENATSVQTLFTNELNVSALTDDKETIWNVWVRPFRLINKQFVFHRGETVYGPTPSVCEQCDTKCPSYDVMMGSLTQSDKLDIWMLYDSPLNGTNSLEQAKKLIRDLITINGYEENDIMLASDYPLQIGINY